MSYVLLVLSWNFVAAPNCIRRSEAKRQERSCAAKKKQSQSGSYGSSADQLVEPTHLLSNDDQQGLGYWKATRAQQSDESFAT